MPDHEASQRQVIRALIHFDYDERPNKVTATQIANYLNRDVRAVGADLKRLQEARIVRKRGGHWQPWEGQK